MGKKIGPAIILDTHFDTFSILYNVRIYKAKKPDISSLTGLDVACQGQSLLLPSLKGFLQVCEITGIDDVLRLEPAATGLHNAESHVIEVRRAVGIGG